ncbi:MAG: polyprenyl synthetase family protein, partial [Bdellovibrionales bacterium]|nr:polyprenyl synthetase family protein [Bdellovibrionales bacterium]
MQDCITLIDKRLKDFIAEKTAAKHLTPSLSAAVEYSLFPSGKRLRPLLSLCLAMDFKIEKKLVLDPACAIEIIHCASLVHDDLPALDNDDFRRGKAACHKAFSEATAILAGDVMFSLAIELALSNLDEKASQYAALLSKAFTKLCSGQKLDILPLEERGNITDIHALKTGSLFAVASSIVGIAANLSENEVENLNNFGEKLGIYFQIADDYLDLYGNENEAGREPGSDQRNSKQTVFS